VGPCSPSELLRERARRELARVASAAMRVGVGLAVALPVGISLLAIGGPVAFGVTLVGLGVVLPSLFFVAAYRSSAAARAVDRGPYRRVHAVGWCRPPDGCNYAIFEGPERSRPSWVLRLPLRRPMTTADAWLCGAPQPSWFTALALIDDSGDVLGAGRIVAPRTAVTRWNRREAPPSRLVAPPPRNWYPPGSH
jgi:hypothetical protein